VATFPSAIRAGHMQQSFRLIVSALVLVFATVQAQAHPHVWIIARTEMLSDAEGRLLALRHTWTFDPAYSAFAVMGLDKDGDGKPDPNELGKMAATMSDHCRNLATSPRLRSTARRPSSAMPRTTRLRMTTAVSRCVSSCRSRFR
jgi:hypothetical protein